MNSLDNMITTLPGLSRRRFLTFALQLLLYANLPSCKRTSHYFDGSSPVSPYVVEDHSQFLSRWAEQGIRDAVLINVDTHDDIVRIPEQKITQLNNLYRHRNWDGFKAADELTAVHRGLFGVANWIYAGGKLGIFKEVYWVIPFASFKDLSPDFALRQLLTEVKFRDEDIGTFRLNNGLFSGTVDGIPFTLCGVESLPTINSPLLLSIDVDFFPMFCDVHEVSYLSALHTLFLALYSKKYQVVDAAVCYSINGEYLQPHLRWVGDAVVQSFLNPQMLRNDTPSELLNLQQYLENAYRTLGADEILKLSGQYLNKYQEPSMHLYRAYAYMLLDDVASAYGAAIESCRLDSRYSSGMMYLGTQYYIKKQYQSAEKFYQGAISIDPGIRIGLFQYGNCLQKLGKIRESLRVYELDVTRNGPFPTEFMMVEAYMRLGERAAAIRTFKEALRHLDEFSSPVVTSNTYAEALYKILEFMEQNGLKEAVATFRRRPMMQRMFNDFPQH